MIRRASRRSSKAATFGRRRSLIFGLNTLTDSQRMRVLRLADTGLSFRAIERLTGHRRETISRYVRHLRDRGPSREQGRARADAFRDVRRRPSPDATLTVL